MKKLFMTMFLIAGMQLITFAQNSTEEGDMKVQAGFRIYGEGMGIGGSFDYSLNTWSSVGGGVDLYVDAGSTYLLYARANLHVGNLIGLGEKIDIYPGADLGLNAGKFHANARLGIRYYFSDTIGGFAEIGTHTMVGVVFSLN